MRAEPRPGTHVSQLPALIEAARAGALPGREFVTEAELHLSVMRLLQRSTDGRKPDACFSRRAARRARISDFSRRRPGRG